MSVFDMKVEFDEVTVPDAADVVFTVILGKERFDMYTL